VPRIETFYLGLGLIIIGTGLLKPNVSSMVGTLYAEKDARRDSGFSLFYMGINVGATASPLVCGWLGQRVSWHAGFAAAGVGMLLGLTQYVLGSRHLARVRTAAMSTAARRTAKAAQAPLTGGDWRRIGLILVLFFFAIVFWSAFEQAGSSLTLFADRYTRLSILGFSFPSSWFQSEQPLFVITLAPLFAWLWIALGRREPSSTTKFALGLLLVSAGFLILTPAAYIAQGQHQRVSPLWLTALYFVHTLGELCLSPVGLSLVTKLSPPRVLGMMMGVWFLGTAFGNFLAGRVAALFDVIPVYQLFGGVCTITLIAGTILLILGRPIQRLAGQKPQAVPPLDSIAA
jgi:POT family proton-dependent oligopeptide transporter